MRTFLSRSLCAIALLLCVALFSCDRSGVEERGYSVVRVTSIPSFVGPDQHFSEKGLLLRRDARGFFVMSTLCTHDITPLEIQQNGEERVWYAPENGSVYSWDGKVLRGPARADLPYYELELLPGSFGGPVDTLFAKIGYKVDPEWRLLVTEVK